MLINKKIMDHILMDRDEVINKLFAFTKATNEQLNEMVMNFKWTEESIRKTETTLICPFNSSHRLYEKTVEKHIENCLWKAEGYSQDDLPLSIPSVPPDSSTTLKFDEQLVEDILQQSKNASSQKHMDYRLIPRTSDRLLSSFTPDERKVLYDYVISNTEKLELGEDIEDINKKSNEGSQMKSFSYLELLAHERNLKRRRAKHRGVHTNKKSQTEIMREVINQQMEILAEYLGGKGQDGVSSNSEDSREKSRGRELKETSSSKANVTQRRHSSSEREFSRDYGCKRYSSDRRSVSSFSNKHSLKTDRSSCRNDRNRFKDDRDRHKNGEKRRSMSPKETKSLKYSESHEKYKSRREERHSRRSRSPKCHESREKHGHNHLHAREEHGKHRRHRSRDRDEKNYKKHKSKSSKRSRERDDDEYYSKN